MIDEIGRESQGEMLEFEPTRICPGHIEGIKCLLLSMKTKTYTVILSLFCYVISLLSGKNLIVSLFLLYQ